MSLRCSTSTRTTATGRRRSSLGAATCSSARSTSTRGQAGSRTSSASRTHPARRTCPWHPLGFRVAGTPEEREATAFVAAEMRDLGLDDVVEEPVPVDGWRLEEAFVELADGTRFECASFGGVPETGRAGIGGDLVAVGRGGRRQLDRLDLRGKIALVEWRVSRLWPYHVGLELGLRGAAAMVGYSPPGGP